MTTFSFDPATLQQLTTQGLISTVPTTPPDLTDVQVVIWSKQWNITAGPVRCELECAVNYTPQTQSFVFGSEATLNVIGRRITFKKDFPVNGDTQRTFDLPFNCKLQIDIHNWSYSQQQLVCDLLARFKPGSLPYIAVSQGRIMVPIPSTQEIQELCTLRLDGPTMQVLQNLMTLPVTVNEVHQPGANFGYTQV
jgi:hypothetical protein